MKNQVYWELPEGYRQYLDLRLAEDRKQLKLLLILQLLATGLTIASGLLICPLHYAFDMPPMKTAAAMGFMSVGLIVYIIAHEWVHGMAIRFITGRQADFGIELKKGMAYASSDAWFGRAPYIVIALAPVIFWGLVLGVMLYEAPNEWFWYIYVIQIMNISGSVGDFYVTWLTLRAPKETIVRDYGTSMMFYVPESITEDAEKTS